MCEKNPLNESLALRLCYFLDGEEKENIVFIDGWEELFCLIFILSMKIRKTNQSKYTFHPYKNSYLNTLSSKINSFLIYHKTPREGFFSFSKFLENQKIMEGYCFKHLKIVNHSEIINNTTLEILISKTIDCKDEKIKLGIMSFDFKPIEDIKTLEMYRLFANGDFSQSDRVKKHPKSSGWGRVKGSGIFRRRMNTIQEIKEAEKTSDMAKEENLKINHRKRDLPTLWDDIRFFGARDRSWKRFRKTRYKIKAN